MFLHLFKSTGIKNGRKCKNISCPQSSLKLICLMTTVCILWIEYFCFIFSRMAWPALHDPSGDTDAIRILLVADPQLIGEVNSNPYTPLLTDLAIVDSDRYLRKGFIQAYRQVQPDVVIFLGDLFDEGSVANLSDFISYYLRFQGIFKTHPGVESIHIWGDNDVGGEGSDPKTTEKMDRFQRMFQNDRQSNDKLWELDTVKGVNFIKVDQDYHKSLSKKKQEHLMKVAALSTGRHQILLNHMTLFDDKFAVTQKIVQILKGDLIISANTHKSKIIRCSKCTGDKVQSSHSPYYADETVPTPGHVYSFDLNNKSELVEIVVPACNYRGGVWFTGYGAAVLGSDGVLQYSVLSLPCRKLHLLIYMFLITASILISVIKLFLRNINHYRSNLKHPELNRRSHAV